MMIMKSLKRHTKYPPGTNYNDITKQKALRETGTLTEYWHALKYLNIFSYNVAFTTFYLYTDGYDLTKYRREFRSTRSTVAHVAP